MHVPRPLQLLAIAAVVGTWFAAACDRRDVAPSAPNDGKPSTAAPAAARTLEASQHTPPPATRATAQRSLAWLAEQLRAQAGDPDNPWALAHGLLAFGKDFETRDGRSAVLVAASFAERTGARYGFPAERDGKPVEPHPHMLVKTFLEVGVEPSSPLRAADGASIDLRRLLTDMRAGVREPEHDTQWHDAAWWLSALELAPAQDGPDLARLREEALARLESDAAVFVDAPADPFAPTAKMGAAKRAKSHLYGHPCGGLHFVQAVLRGAGSSASSDLRARVSRQVRLQLDRYEAERDLYAGVLRAHPSARLMISGQQLKFFGHLLETLALADELGVVRQDAALRQAVTAARRRAATDLLATLTQLEHDRAYGRLAKLSEKQPQLALDLVGDGCHAIHGLGRTLDVLPSP